MLKINSVKYINPSLVDQPQPLSLLFYYVTDQTILLIMEEPIQ